MKEAIFELVTDHVKIEVEIQINAFKEEYELKMQRRIKEIVAEQINAQNKYNAIIGNLPRVNTAKT